MDMGSQASMILIITAALVSVAWMRSSSAAEGAGRTEKADKAIKKVLRNMAKASKPLRLPPAPNNTRTPLIVGLDFGLTAVTDVNVNGGFVDLEGLLNLMWVDPRLKFDLPKSSKEIRTLRVNPKTIWTPDIALYRGMSPGLQILTSQPSAVVSRSGDIFLGRQVRLRSACDVIGQLSRSDILNCTVRLGSWSYNGLELQLSMTPLNSDKLHDFQGTGLWVATAATAWVGEKSYACCPETFPYAQFSFSLRKRSLPHWLQEKQSVA